MKPTLTLLAKSAGVIAVVTLAARLLGFVRSLAYGAAVGSGEVGTAYASANLLPSVVFEIVAGGALAAMIIPLVAHLPISHPPRPRPSHPQRAVVHAQPESGDQIVSVIATWSLLITGLLSAVIWVFSGELSAFLFRDSGAASPQVTQLGATFLRIFAPQLPLYAVTITLGAYLQSRRKFLWPAAAPLVSSAVVIASYVVYGIMAPSTHVSAVPTSAIAVLGWGTTAGVLAMALTVLIPALRTGLRLRLRLRLEKDTMRRALALAGSGIGTVIAQQAVITLILVSAARAGGMGTLPLFQYGQAVYALPFALLIVPIMTSVFPELSRMHQRGEDEDFSRLALGSMRAVIASATLGTALVWGAGIALDRFFLFIDRASIAGTGAVAAALALGLGGYAVVSHSTRILNAASRPADALVVGATPWGIAGLLIVASFLFSPQRATADAAALYGLCISAGMIIGSVAALALVRDRVLSTEHAAALVRAVTVGACATVLGSVAGLGFGGLIAGWIVGPWSAVGVGILAGGVGALVALAALAIGDGELARPILARVRLARAQAVGREGSSEATS